MSTPTTGRRFRFADLTMRSKVLGLIGVAAVLTLSIAWMSQIVVSNMQSITQMVVADGAEPALAAQRATEAWAEYRRYTLQVLLSSDEAATNAALAGIGEHEKLMQDSFSAYRKAAVTADQKQAEQAAEDAFQAAGQAWHGGLQAIAVEATTPQKQAAAYQKLTAQFVPLADKVTAALDETVAQDMVAMDAVVAGQQRYVSRTITFAWLVVGVGVGVLLLAGWWLAGMMARPVVSVRNALDRLADGDLTDDLHLDSRDEVGQMAAALGRAQDSIRDSIRTISDSSTTLAGSAEQLSVVSAQVASSAQETSAQSGVAAAAAEEVSRGVQTVAAATEQMTGSISEIAQSSTEAVRVATRAVEEAASATATVSKLGESSREIGDVVKVITSIAEQTNLLALNATIEAARAGEAGKGFAVVATEVKDLAQETARATEDISERVATIQVDAEAAVAAIAQISQIIEQVNSYQTTIASAVEEQTATTQEMSRNVSDAAVGAGSIAENIESVAASAASSSSGIVEAQRSAQELASLSNDLRSMVAKFRL